MCCIESLGNGASGEWFFCCFRPPTGGRWKGVYDDIAVRVGSSQIGDSSMIKGVFAVPSSIVRSMMRGETLREEDDEDTEEHGPDCGNSEPATRLRSAREELVTEVTS